MRQTPFFVEDDEPDEDFDYDDDLEDEDEEDEDEEEEGTWQVSQRRDRSLDFSALKSL